MVVAPSVVRPQSHDARERLGSAAPLPRVRLQVIGVKAFILHDGSHRIV